MITLKECLDSMSDEEVQLVEKIAVGELKVISLKKYSSFQQYVFLYMISQARIMNKMEADKVITEMADALVNKRSPSTEVE